MDAGGRRCCAGWLTVCGAVTARGCRYCFKLPLVFSNAVGSAVGLLPGAERRRAERGERSETSEVDEGVASEARGPSGARARPRRPERGERSEASRSEAGAQRRATSLQPSLQRLQKTRGKLNQHRRGFFFSIG